MASVLFSISAFLVALGVLISIHEFGHFWVARKLGVKVLRFSVGFGKPLFKKIGTQDQTEYVVAAIPLGGYVKMLDEREGTVAEDEKHLAFNNKSVWARIAIVAAGPIANFILAIIAYWVMYLIGISGVLPIIGGVDKGSVAAKAGFQVEDQIISIDGVKAQTWNEVRIALLDKSLQTKGSIEIGVRDIDGVHHSRFVSVDSSVILNGDGDVIGDLGIQHWWPDVKPIIGGVQDGGAAATAGLQVGDEIFSANGEIVSNWRQWVEVVRAHPNQLLSLLILRDGQEQRLDITPAVREVQGEAIGFIGAWETQSRSQIERARTVVQYAPLEAFNKSISQTWNMSFLTLQMLVKLVVGEASLENISGPITIAQFAGQSASVGLDHYLSFIALISISLGVLNLLPVPILDGGHLLYFVIEAIKGSPLPDKAQLYGQQLGMLLLAGLMSIAFYNDIVRLVG